MSNAIDLITLSDLKIRLSLPQTAGVSDQALQNLITATSADFMKQASRPALFNATYNESRNGQGGHTMVTKVGPIISIASLTINNQVISLSPDGVQPGFVFDDIEVMLIGYRFVSGFQNVRIVYIAGYGTNLSDPSFPTDIPGAILDWCHLRWKQNEQAGVSGRSSPTGEHISYDKHSMPDTTKRVVLNYKRVAQAR